MAEPHVINALVEKYRELSGKLVEVEKQQKEIRQQLKVIDHTIRLYRSDFEVTGIRPKRPYKQNPYFPRGQFYRVVMDILRDAKESMTARELAIEALRRQGIEPDSDLADQFRRTLNGRLVKYAKAGKIQVNENVFPKRWRIILS